MSTEEANVITKNAESTIDTLNLSEIVFKNVSMSNTINTMDYISKHQKEIKEVVEMFNNKFGRKIISPQDIWKYSKEIIELSSHKTEVENLLGDLESLLGEKLPTYGVIKKDGVVKEDRVRKLSILDYADSIIKLAASGEDFKTLLKEFDKRDFPYRLYSISDPVHEEIKCGLLSQPELAIDFAKNREKYLSLLDELKEAGYTSIGNKEPIIGYAPDDIDYIILYANRLKKLQLNRDKVMNFLKTMKEEWDITPKWEPHLNAKVLIPLAENLESLTEFFNKYKKFGDVNPPNLISEKGLRDVRNLKKHYSTLLKLAEKFKDIGFRLDLYSVGHGYNTIKEMITDYKKIETLFSYFKQKAKVTMKEASELGNQFVEQYKDKFSFVVNNPNITKCLMSNLEEEKLKVNAKNFFDESIYLDTLYRNIEDSSNIKAECKKTIDMFIEFGRGKVTGDKLFYAHAGKKDDFKHLG